MSFRVTAIGMGLNHSRMAVIRKANELQVVDGGTNITHQTEYSLFGAGCYEDIVRTRWEPARSGQWTFRWGKVTEFVLVNLEGRYTIVIGTPFSCLAQSFQLACFGPIHTLW